MKLLLVVAFLVTLPEGLLVSSIEMDVQNAAIEIFNDCKCVPWYQCDENGRVISRNSRPNVLLARINLEISKIECLSNSTEKYYCCKTENVKTKAAVEEVECGIGRTLMIPRIFNDEDDSSTSDGEFPWMAAIFLKKGFDDYSFKCGGSLIHPQVVLTANHCIVRKHANNLMVVVNGKTEVSLSEEEGKRNVTEIVRHPKYRHTSKLYYDAALLILEQPLVVGEDGEVSTICLPPAGVDMEGMQCLVAGWGRDQSKRREEDLRKVELPFVNHSQCDVLLKNSRLGWRFNLHESFMCAGGEEGKDACVGDGGGPLMCPMPKEDNQYFQAGIVSWGIGCGLKNVPGIYTDVGIISDWIKTELKNRNIRLC